MPDAAIDAKTQREDQTNVSPSLPLAVPVPVGQGTAGNGFPFPWPVHRWLTGRDLAGTSGIDLSDAAVRLGRFVRVLQRLDAAGGPPSFRGHPIRAADTVVRARIRKLGAPGLFDVGAAIAVWETILAAPDWAEAPAWIHADLYPTNQLATHGPRLGAAGWPDAGLVSWCGRCRRRHLGTRTWLGAGPGCRRGGRLSEKQIPCLPPWVVARSPRCLRSADLPMWTCQPPRGAERSVIRYPRPGKMNAPAEVRRRPHERRLTSRSRPSEQRTTQPSPAGPTHGDRGPRGGCGVRLPRPGRTSVLLLRRMI